MEYGRGRTRLILVLARCALLLAIALAIPVACRADDPYARSRDYDLQNVRTHLWLSAGKKTIRGEVTHSISILRDNVSQIRFDSVDLKIEDVTLDGKPAKFVTNPNDVTVSLDRPAKRGERHEVFIRYAGEPKKGLYFIFPDKNYPQRPHEVWSQGESEDTRYYIPIYDYPNDRTTSKMILTVPATWTTISNGRLAGVKDDPEGTKTWEWKQSETLSTYLISVVAGEFVEQQDKWRGIPVRYVVPRGEEYKIPTTFARTKEMLDAFSDRLDVPYPWAQYAQSSVDDFVVGGMENTSATTLTAQGLVHPKLAAEARAASDGLDSHELAHQWFGDLVTCNDWGNIWLNEGFATYFEHYWNEHHYGVDEVEYEFWKDQGEWFAQKQLFAVPIVTHDYTDMIEFEGNIYTKGSLVLRMLREKLGDDYFFAGLHHYLDANRGHNVVTADLQKAIEQETSVNVDRFFHQWLYRAGAPQFEVSYTFDTSTHQVKLDVKQTQKVERLVGLFDVPVDVEITTASGSKTYPIQVNQASQSFTLAADSAPLMLVFDRGDKILKALDFKRSPASLIYQLKNGETVPDRADAAVALGKVKDNREAVVALGEAAQHDRFWGVRVESLKSLGKIGTLEAQKEVLAALHDDTPWVRDVAVAQLGKFKNDPSLASTLADIAANDKAYRVRGEALKALAQSKSPNAFDMLNAAVKMDSPDDTIRQASLQAFGSLDDDRAVPILLEWAAAGKPLDTRSAAISAVAALDKNNKEITKALISFLQEPYFNIKFSALFALGSRGDQDAIGPLEALLKSGELSIGAAPYIESQIALLKAQAGDKSAVGLGKNPHEVAAGASSASAAGGNESVVNALQKLETEIDEVNSRLSKIESQLSDGAKK
ncbi:MAG: M1 family aminopeptidase [Candidatus Acidiferrales bacterium]